MNDLNDKLKKNRIWVRLAICLLGSVILGFIMNQYRFSTPLYTGLLSVVFIILLIIYYYVVNKYKRREVFLRLILINTILFFLIYVVFYEITLLFYEFTTSLQLVIVGICVVFVLFNYVYIVCYYKKQKLSLEEIIYLVGFLAFLFRAMYALFNPISNVSRQHDTIAFTNGGGHLGYIWYVWAYGKVPNVDPRNYWEFYQPPLYYLICGYWVNMYTFLKVPIIEAAENIQLFSLFCVTGTGIVADEIVYKYTNCNKNRLFLSIIMLICPLFAYLAGSVNNDSLLLFMFTISVYLILKWYDNPTFKNIIISAFAVGMTVMTKNSGALIALGILLLFVVHIIKNKNIKGCLQYLCFGLVSLPIGLWWNIRNVIRFNMPFLYYNPANKDSVQYIPDYSLFERFFDVRYQLNHLYVDAFNTSQSVDHNIVITTFKTILYTCSAEITMSSLTKVLGTGVFIMAVICLAIILIRSVNGMMNSDVKTEIKSSLLLIIISSLLFYLHFIISEPFVHTMHARYVMPAMTIGMICACLTKRNNSDKKFFIININKLYIVASLFACSCVTFTVSYIILITLMTFRT